MAKETTMFKTAYGAKMRVAIETGEGLTEQAHKNEVDINNIVKRYDKTGAIAHINEFEKKYADVTGIDYQQAMNTIAAGNSMFEELPSDWRKKFDNSVVNFINFLDDPKNHEELVNMGIVQPKKEEVDLQPYIPPVDEGSKEPVKASESAGTEAKQS